MLVICMMIRLRVLDYALPWPLNHTECSTTYWICRYFGVGWIFRIMVIIKSRYVDWSFKLSENHKFLALLICRSGKLITKPKILCLSVCPLAWVAQIEVTGPRGLISDIQTPWTSTTRHTKLKILILDFIGQSWIFPF